MLYNAYNIDAILQKKCLQQKAFDLRFNNTNIELCNLFNL